LIHDNFSSDSSWSLITVWANNRKYVKAYRFSRNIGYQQSLTLSFNHATGSAFVVLQSDRQDPIDLIINMYDSWKFGNKCVVGVAKNRAEGISEKIGRFVFVWLFRKTSDLKLDKWFTDFYLLDKSLYKQFESLPLTNQFIRGRIIESFKIDQFLTYDRMPRRKGVSKFNFAKKYSLALDGLLLHGSKIIRRLVVSGVFVFFIGILAGLIFYLFFFQIDDGVNLAMGVIGAVALILNGFVIVLIGISLEYLIRLHQRLQSSESTNNQKTYLIAETINLNSPKRRGFK